MSTSIIEKIGLLLRQAEGTDNEAEASAFTAKAQSLATTHAVDLAIARQSVAKREKREEPEQQSIFFGKLGTRNTKKHLVSLFGAVADANDVKNDIFHSSHGVIVYGFPSDIEVTEALFASLAVQMVEAANAYLKTGEYKSETVEVTKYVTEDGYWGRERIFDGYVTKPVDGRTARANFYQGFIARISSRLYEARAEALAAPVVLESGEESTGELVLADKGLEVRDYYRGTSKARGSWSGYGGGYSGASRSAGSEAGSSARLSSQKALGGARTAIA